MEASLRAAPARLRPRPGDSVHDSALKEEKEELGPEFLQSLARGLAVLRALGSRTGGLTLSEAAEDTGLARATARRALITLHHLGYVRADGRNFSLTPRVLELGYAPLQALSFEEIVRPHLTDLTERLGESSSIAVLDGDDVRYVARVATSRIMSVNIAVGTRFPAYATSMGRVLVAGLPPADLAAYLARVRPKRHTPHTRTGTEELRRIVDAAARDGYALVDQELEEGLRSVAVPIRGRDGQVTAAVNVAQHVGRGTGQQMLDETLPAVTETAARITADLGIVGERRPVPVL